MKVLSATRPRLSRTLSAARWHEYRALLVTARRHGYEIVSLEDWVRRNGAAAGPTLILRHDVDQHPASALKFAAIERELGVTSTWYFRWRTAHPSVVRRLRAERFAVGLHYETLSRMAVAEGIRSEQRLTEAIPECREVLRREIAAFVERFGPIRSVCPHGDSRVPFARNALLLRGEECLTYGVEFDGNEAMRGRPLGYWLTDRSRPDGSWKDAISPIRLLASRVSPILCLTHPNNWAAGPSLWIERTLRAMSLPLHLSRPPRVVVGGPDEPPI